MSYTARPERTPIDTTCSKRRGGSRARRTLHDDHGRAAAPPRSCPTDNVRPARGYTRRFNARICQALGRARAPSKLESQPSVPLQARPRARHPSAVSRPVRGARRARATARRQRSMAIRLRRWRQTMPRRQRASESWSPRARRAPREAAWLAHLPRAQCWQDLVKDNEKISRPCCEWRPAARRVPYVTHLDASRQPGGGGFAARCAEQRERRQHHRLPRPTPSASGLQASEVLVDELSTLKSACTLRRRCILHSRRRETATCAAVRTRCVSVRHCDRLPARSLRRARHNCDSTWSTGNRPCNRTG